METVWYLLCAWQRPDTGHVALIKSDMVSAFTELGSYTRDVKSCLKNETRQCRQTVVIVLKDTEWVCGEGYLSMRRIMSVVQGLLKDEP